MSTSGAFESFESMLTKAVSSARERISDYVPSTRPHDMSQVSRVDQAGIVLTDFLEAFKTELRKNVEQAFTKVDLNLFYIVDRLRDFATEVDNFPNAEGFEVMNRILNSFEEMFNTVSMALQEVNSPGFGHWSFSVSRDLSKVRAVISQNEQLKNFDDAQIEVSNIRNEAKDWRETLDQVRRLSSDVESLRQTAQHAQNNLDSEWNSLSSQIDGFLGHSKEQASKVEEVLASAISVSENKASEELQASFMAYGKQNDERARLNQTWANAFYLLTIGFAIFTTFWVYADRTPAGWPDVVWRIAIVSGGLGFATYLSKQASHHRAQYNWAHAINIQLRTFRAYTDLIPDSTAKDDLRTYFARRVFGAEPGSSNANSDDIGPNSGLDDLNKITSILKNMGPLNSPPK